MNTHFSFHPESFEKKWPRTSLSSSRGLRPRSRGAAIRGEQEFHPGSFEKKWQGVWAKERLYQPDISKSKKPFYNLMMFPYPSAEGLHVGNMYAFTGVDVYGRFMRMQGHDVFEPIGLDGFGIHSENYAIKLGKHPKEQAKVSEKNFYRQLASIGNGFAWENRLETYDPDYYRWTQWLFIQLFKKGLAYRKKSPVNFCPSCKTVLSDEQVINGLCERCKSVVEKRDMEQWFFRITDYAERLLQNTYRDDFQWTEKVKIGQRHWIGKKEGINIRYQVSGIKYQVECFTTTPVNWGATFLVLSPEHPLVKVLTTKEQKKDVTEYINLSSTKSDMDRIAEGKEKTGVFTGSYAVNHVTKKKIPIWISDFVLMNVGTGAIQGCPGHDARDFDFAKKFGLPIPRVVVGEGGDSSPITRVEQVVEKGMKGKMINSDFLNGVSFDKAMQMTMDYFEQKGWGKRIVTYKLRDWCISRQRYWGVPIPMITCPACGWVPVPDDQLPVLLPDIEDWKPEGTGKGPLAKIQSFVRTTCPQCGGPAERETDVCDTFLDSSWYFLRYPFQHHRLPKLPKLSRSPREQLPWDRKTLSKWLPVHMYIGGAEHTVLHLLYARFVTMALKDSGYLDFEEPFSRFYAHGLIIKEGAKMSKSKGNIVNPDEYIQKYGSDTLRTYLMFLGPFDAGGDFRDTGILGMHKFLGRVWRLVSNSLSHRLPRVPKSLRENTMIEKNDLDRAMHRAVKEVTEDMKNLRYNTAIAHIMEYVNELTAATQNITSSHTETLLLLLAPFAPHMTEELYQQMKQGSAGKEFTSIHKVSWPIHDQSALTDHTTTIVIQVNGKLRDSFAVISTLSTVQEEIEKRAKESDKAKKFLEGKTIRTVIFVPGKLINFVVS